ncbi:MAG TPA: response regulator [Vicinamibacterales bacterium]|nr:response regulator [Vicinamibacterales bacterium]
MTSRPDQVLLVDHDSERRRMYRTALTLAGLEVHDAGDGLDALRQIDQTTPEIIVLDLVLPDISGLDLRQEIAAHAHTRDIPLVIVTDGLDPGMLNAPCVLRRPVSPEQLVSTVLSCLSSGAPGLSS